MQVQDDNEPYDQINVVPMLDLAYVLLVIFIIMTTASVQGIEVNLPKASDTPSLAKPKTKAITVTQDGQVYLDTYPVSMDELRTQLAAAKAAVDALAYVPVTGVTVTGAAAVAVGATLQLTATIAPAGAAGYRVSWSSADPTKVTVSETGLVQRLAAGAVPITATSVDDPTKSGTASIT